MNGIAVHSPPPRGELRRVANVLPVLETDIWCHSPEGCWAGFSLTERFFNTRTQAWQR